MSVKIIPECQTSDRLVVGPNRINWLLFISDVESDHMSVRSGTKELERNEVIPNCFLDFVFANFKLLKRLTLTIN